MEILNKKINDRLTMEELVDDRKSPFRTQITATDEWGDVIFTREHNMVVLGGAITVLEKLWNIRSSLVVDTINNINKINAATQSTSTILPVGNIVCLWGIGIGGAGDAFGSVKDVKFYEREIAQNGQGDTQMIPFRTVSTELTDTAASTYFLKKTTSNSLYAYYAKKFASDPFIRTLWVDGAAGEDGTEVTADVYSTSRTEDIECFVEMHLKLEKTDVREYFTSVTNNIEQARINTIGLFTGEPVTDASGKTEYQNVKLFSKFNFDNESLTNKKEINFTYRIFAS